MKRLILTGEIGTGKTSLIRTALGDEVRRAGGFITGRIFEDTLLRGYALAPAAALADPAFVGQSCLTLSPTPHRNDTVVAESGVRLLAAALDAPFAVADEFGGLELQVSPFYAALLALLRSDVPVIGVLKTPEALRALSEKISPENDYSQRANALRSMLEADPDTMLLPVSGWDDPFAIQTIQAWVNAYVRRDGSGTN